MTKKEKEIIKIDWKKARPIAVGLIIGLIIGFAVIFLVLK